MDASKRTGSQLNLDKYTPARGDGAQKKQSPEEVSVGDTAGRNLRENIPPVRTQTTFQATSTLSTNHLKNAARNIKNKVSDFFQTATKKMVYLGSNEVLAGDFENKAERDKRSSEVRENLMNLGGEGVTITTPDEVHLDAMYLDAAKFRKCLKDANCELTTYSLVSKEKTHLLQGISVPVADWENSGQRILDSLAFLNAVKSDESRHFDHPGAGWTAIKNGEEVLLVRTENIPQKGGSNHFFQFDYVKYQYFLKKLPYEKTAEKINDEKPASGTVIISSGGEGVYEKHHAEAVYYLFRNMNVVLFNFRGYGKSEGIPTESGFKIDMESAYQLAKSKSGQNDEKILSKALCLSGGPAAYVASKHPKSNIFLDQSYSSFRTLCKDLVEDRIRLFLGYQPSEEIRQKAIGFLASCISFVANLFTHFMTPDFQVAKYLAKIEGQKALFFAENDQIIGRKHTEALKGCF